MAAAVRGENIKHPNLLQAIKPPQAKGFCSSQKDDVLGVTGKTLTWMQRPSGTAQAGIRERQRQRSKRAVLRAKIHTETWDLF